MLARPAFRPSIWRPSRLRRAPVAASRQTEWGESTYEGLRWQHARHAGRRWAIAGALCGLLVALPAFAPATWLAGWVERASGGQLLLGDARGSLWGGSAVAVLAGGPGSRDARALPGRLHWTIRPAGLALRVELEQACCLNGRVALTLRPGLGRVDARLETAPGWTGRWPAAWLEGLGTPWNTVQLAGTLRLASPGLQMQWVRGRWRVDGGEATLEVLDAASRLSTLERLGSYRLRLDGHDPNGTARLELATTDGALRLSGQGTLGPGGLRLRGEARAAEGDEAALANLLNIIGRRDGARSIIAIG